MEASRVIIGLLFLAVGVVLFLGAIAIRLQMEKEVKGGFFGVNSIYESK